MMQAAIPRQQLQFLHCSLRLPCLLNEFMCNCGVRYNDDRLLQLSIILNNSFILQVKYLHVHPDFLLVNNQVPVAN